MKYCCGRNRQGNKKPRAQSPVNKRYFYINILSSGLRDHVLQHYSSKSKHTFQLPPPLFFHLQSAVKFDNFAILGGRELPAKGRERTASVDSNLRSERYEEIRKILIKIAQGFLQTDKTRPLKCSFPKL